MAHPDKFSAYKIERLPVQLHSHLELMVGKFEMF